MKKFDFEALYKKEGYERRVGFAEYRVWVAEQELARARAINAKTEKGLAKKEKEIAFWENDVKREKDFLAFLLANK